MKIFLNYKTTNNPWGGINSFLRSFKEYVDSERSDVIITDSIEDFDIFFMAAASSSATGEETDKNYIEKLIKRREKLFEKYIKRTRYKIVHRLDGLRAIYKGEFIPNDQVQIDLSQLADYIIFQSKFSLYSFEKFGYNKNNYTIIHNGVNQNIFNCNGKIFSKNKKIKVLSSSWSDGLNKGFKTIADFSENERVESYFVGRWNESVDKKNVKVIPPIEREQLAELYKTMDVFLHAAKNDPCPNVVLEALSCGLPVLYHNSGGTVEIASRYGVSLSDVINEKNINNTIDEILDNYTLLIERIQDDLYDFSIRKAADLYIQEFNSLLDR